MTASPPLAGVRVIELAGLAPAPFASLLLADYGACILRIDRPHLPAHSLNPRAPTSDSLTRHKSSIALNLKQPQSLALLKAILARADVFIEPFRPGVLESLDLSPETLLATNTRLIIARLSGFRRDGPYAHMAGHDINYLAVSGILSQLGRRNSPPYAPANILADFAGGGLMCAFGILMALLSRSQTGRGQVVEANMVDGVGYLGSFMRYAKKTPMWDRPRGENVLDGGCPWYEVYETRDKGFMAVGALEPQFFTELANGLGLDSDLGKRRHDRATWPAMKEAFGQKFREKTRQEWEQVFRGKDACCTPVATQQELEKQGYEQRPAVALKSSPGLAVPKEQHWKSEGLSPGDGGEKILKDWMGWRRGREYEARDSGLAMTEVAKL